MKLTNSILTLAAAALIGGVMAPSAFAASHTCKVGTETDFTYRGDAATLCEAGNFNPGDPFSAFGTDWDELVKFDQDQDAGVGTIWDGDPLSFGGGTITFSLKYLGLGLDDFYGYELLAVAVPLSLLPANMDLVGVVKQGDGFQAYFFGGALVDSSGNLGTFKSLFAGTNNDFSHFSIYGGNFVGKNGNGNGNEVPEPATLALLGLGLLGVGAMRRRRVS